MYGTSKEGTNNIYFDDYGIKWFWKIRKSIWKILRSYKNVTKQVCNLFKVLWNTPFLVLKQQKKPCLETEVKQARILNRQKNKQNKNGLQNCGKKGERVKIPLLTNNVG